MTHQAILTRVEASGLPAEHAAVIAAHLTQVADSVIAESVGQHWAAIDSSAANNGEHNSHSLIGSFAFGDRGAPPEGQRYATVTHSNDTLLRSLSGGVGAALVNGRAAALTFRYPGEAALITAPAEPGELQVDDYPGNDDDDDEYDEYIDLDED